jgi:hypothetical protein
MQVRCSGARSAPGSAARACGASRSVIPVGRRSSLSVKERCVRARGASGLRVPVGPRARCPDELARGSGASEPRPPGSHAEARHRLGALLLPHLPDPSAGRRVEEAVRHLEKAHEAFEELDQPAPRIATSLLLAMQGGSTISPGHGRPRKRRSCGWKRPRSCSTGEPSPTPTAWRPPRSSSSRSSRRIRATLMPGGYAPCACGSAIARGTPAPPTWSRCGRGRASSGPCRSSSPREG